MEVGGGVPQGSVLGSTLVMELEIGEGVELICYPDDLTILITVRTLSWETEFSFK